MGYISWFCVPNCDPLIPEDPGGGHGPLAPPPPPSPLDPPLLKKLKHKNVLDLVATYLMFPASKHVFLI